jgi:hypothetical protein
MPFSRGRHAGELDYGGHFYMPKQLPVTWYCLVANATDCASAVAQAELDVNPVITVVCCATAGTGAPAMIVTIKSSEYI